MSFWKCLKKLRFFPQGPELPVFKWCNPIHKAYASDVLRSRPEPRPAPPAERRGADLKPWQARRTKTLYELRNEISQEWAQHFGGDTSIAAGTMGQFMFEILMNLAYVIATISENWHGTAKGFGSEQVWWLARPWFQTKINFVYLLPGLICHYTSSNWKHWTKAAIGAVVEKTASKKSHSICWSSPRCWCGITCHDKKQIGFFKEGFMSWHPVSKILQLPSLHTKESLFCLATSPLVGLSDWNDSFWLFDKHVKVRPCWCSITRISENCDHQPR